MSKLTLVHGKKTLIYSKLLILDKKKFVYKKIKKHDIKKQETKNEAVIS